MADRIGYNPDDYEWETAHEEAADQLLFDTLGDEYTGEYLGPREITFTDKDGKEQTFTQLQFRDAEGLKGINAGYELRQAYADIPPHTVTHIKYIKDVPIAGQQSPMKSFRVDIAKAKATPNARSQKG